VLRAHGATVRLGLAAVFIRRLWRIVLFQRGTLILGYFLLFCLHIYARVTSVRLFAGVSFAQVGWVTRSFGVAVRVIERITVPFRWATAFLPRFIPGSVYPRASFPAVARRIAGGVWIVTYTGNMGFSSSIGSIS
jgi:hypothetical protein